MTPTFLPRCLAYAACLVALAACQDEVAGGIDEALAKLSHAPAPPADHSNKYLGDAMAEALGHQLYFDSDLSGPETNEDMLRRPLTTPGRAALGATTGVSCNTCHDVAHAAGADATADPLGHRVSFGAGAYDVNGMQTVNAAYNGAVYWNGRNDSLWAQIVAVTESPVSVGGSRLRTAWRVVDAYRATYAAIFGAAYPLPPEMDSVAQQKARLAGDGTCKLDAGSCPTPFCHSVTVKGTAYCLPRFPLEGRPGYVVPGQAPVCSWGKTPSGDTLQPNGDAYDCMDLADQLAVTQIYVNYAKAVAAYEYQLLSTKAPFDDWVASGFSAGISESAQRGARLFVGKAACVACHAGPLLSDNAFHNVGVPQTGDYVPTEADCPSGGWCDCVSDDRAAPTNCLPWGARDGLRKLAANKFRRDSRWSDDLDCANHFTLHIDANYAMGHPDECDGLIKWYSVPLTPGDDLKGAWKTPSLRNVALTAPYMHTGALASLADVVEHYNKGGVSMLGAPPGTRDAKVKPLNLTELEKQDLVHFLEALTAPVDPAVSAAPTVPATSSF